MTRTAERIHLALGSVPKDGGTFAFYRNLRQGLAGQGIEVSCVSVGRQEASLCEPAFADDGCVLLAADTWDRKKQAQAFAEWCEASRVDIVMALNSVAILSSLPHLPERVRIMARCANAFEHGYRITMSGAERLHRIVALAPAQVPVLADQYGAAPERIVLIPNGTDPDRFANSRRMEFRSGDVLRLGYLGRLEHRQKGVLFLPRILAKLEEAGIQWRLHIAGKGVHEARLRKRLAGFSDRSKVEFLGALAPQQVPAFLAETDVLLFPSQFEGSPNVLIEAMMAGCVPAAWNIPGLIDFVVEDGRTGVLAEPGDAAALAAGVGRLLEVPGRLKAVSLDAAREARRRFSRQRMAADYRILFAEVVSEPPLSWDPLPWSAFRIDPAFRQPAWKAWIPQALQAPLRQAKSRMASATGND